jgi:hypothetical protein
MILDNVNVQYIGARVAGSLSFSSTAYAVAENDPTGVAAIQVIRTGGTAGTFLVGVVTADGTGTFGVNYGPLSVDTPNAQDVVFAEGQTSATVNVPIIDDHLDNGNKTVLLFLSNPTLQSPIVAPIQATLTIVETDAPAPTVSPKVQLVYVPHTRKVMGFQLTFSQVMDSASAQNIANYEILLPPIHKNGPKRAVPIAQAALAASGLVVTLTRGDSGRNHLTKYVQIIVKGRPITGLRSAAGTYLAGNGQSGTDAVLTVVI